MATPIQSERFKAEMPEIPGVSEPGGRRISVPNPAIRLVVGLVVVLAVCVLGARLLIHPKQVHIAAPAPTPRVEVPAPTVDPLATLPRSTSADPTVATLGDMEKPWSSRDFFFVNRTTGQDIPALLIRLPGSASHQPDGYWAIAMNSPYGRCQFEYVTDLDKLRNDYGYRDAKHPMVGNPCTRTLFDPLKRMNILGDVWVRGAIVEGSDLRPPLGILIQVQGKNILALKMES
jgi:hypothetical protein